METKLYKMSEYPNKRDFSFMVQGMYEWVLTLESEGKTLERKLFKIDPTENEINEWKAETIEKIERLNEDFNQKKAKAEAEAEAAAKRTTYGVTWEKGDDSLFGRFD